MSELKSYYYYEDRVITPATHQYRVYHADEVDKEIARQKYKRCYSIAKWCFTKSNYHFVVGRSEGGKYAKENFRRSNLYEKWHKRWLKLANKFKEDK